MNHSEDIEIVLNKIRKNSVELSQAHKKKYEKLKSKLIYFRLPTIILSAVNSVFSVGLSSYMPQSQVSVINCLISLVCGIIVSIELYLSIEKSMQNEYDMSKSYYLLAIEIEKFLSLDRENRQIDCPPFLEKVYNSYCKYFESSRLLKKSIRDSLTPINREKDSISQITPTSSISSKSSQLFNSVFGVETIDEEKNNV